MSGLTMICPSRGRPGNVQRVLESWRQNTDSARLVVVVDPDDPQLPGYKDLDCDLKVLDVPCRLGPALNVVAPELARDADAVGFLSDSHFPRTTGWDTRLVEALPSGGGVSYSNDLLQYERLPTNPVITASLIRDLGYMAPPGLTHLYIDNFWKRLGEDLNALVYLPDVIVEHMHPSIGKAEWDVQWRANNAPEQDHADSAFYSSFLRNQWPSDLARLKDRKQL